MATVNHAAHPGHRLAESHDSSQFYCSGCRHPGSGHRYGCKPCNFWLHPFCAASPREMQSSRHRHRLVMGFERVTGRRTCALCDGEVLGIYYTCNHCGVWDAHILCAAATDRGEVRRIAGSNNGGSNLSSLRLCLLED